MKLFSQDSFKTLPWKNGRGTTSLLYINPDIEDFNLRLSMAKIGADGPFSIYPGYDRHLQILQGAGINILSNDQNTKLTLEDKAFSFPGEWEVTSTLLNDPVVDFNVMIKRNWGKATLDKSKAHIKLYCLEDYLYVFSFKDMVLRELSRGEEFTPGVDSITVDIKLFN